VVLVDGDDLVQIFISFDSIVFTGDGARYSGARTIQALADGTVEDVEYQ
jgi:hypothetical protein